LCSIFSDLKNFSIFVLAFLLFVPPVQAHTDVVVLNDTTENHMGELDEDHHQEHHENETEDEKNSDHHHHCSIVSSITVFIKDDTQIHFVDFLIRKEDTLFSKNLYSSNCLDHLFQPPQTCSVF